MGLAAQQVNAEDFDFCIAVGDLTNDRSVIKPSRCTNSEVAPQN
jgi:hypothetical protein